MDAFPPFSPAGRTVVIVGEGDAAEAKARLFDSSPARCPPEREGRVDPAAYAGAGLVFIAGGDAPSERAARRARRRRPVNVVDRPAMCDFPRRPWSIAARWWRPSAPAAPRRCWPALLRHDIETRVPRGRRPRRGPASAGLRTRCAPPCPIVARRRAFLRAA